MTTTHEASAFRSDVLESYPPIVAKLLASRGLTSGTDVHNFLYGTYDTLGHDPLLLSGMERAVDRILDAIQKKEHILVYHDYDMDGIPGAVILKDFFDAIHYTEVSYRCPHRNEEGFGLHEHIVTEAKEKQVALIITVDCGIADVDEVAHARKEGIDVIITDHHLPHEKLPDAAAIVNPNIPGDPYPNKALCGAGVALKLVEALAQHFPDVDPRTSHDMAGAATLSDMVVLHGENRALAKSGLARIRQSRRVGLQSLCKKVGATQSHFSEDDLSFLIAPRINAASRMDQADIAFELLGTHDTLRAGELATVLEDLNGERKTTVALMVKDALSRLSLRDPLPPVIVIGDPRWKPGLAGLVAQSLMDKFSRPIFVWGRDGERPHLRGSCRSKPPIDLQMLFAGASEIFSEAGGHAYSGGFGVEQTRLSELEPALVAAFEKHETKKGAEPEVVIDGILEPDDVSWETYRAIELLGPFGSGNPKPLFSFRNVVPKIVEQFGKEKTHLRIVIPSRRSDISGIAFFKKANAFRIAPEVGKPMTLLAHMEESFFRGVPELRLRIVDIVP